MHSSLSVGLPVHDDVTWVSGYEVNPLEVPTREKAALLVDWTERLRAGAAVAHARRRYAFEGQLAHRL